MKGMKRLFRLKHEREYHWGLALLLASCLSLVWGLWRDDFKPDLFLAGLLLFSWGYLLLWRHDINERFASLTKEIADLGSQAETRIVAQAQPWAEELPFADAEEGEKLFPAEF